jgi:hypothetical protein
MRQKRRFSADLLLIQPDLAQYRRLFTARTPEDEDPVAAQLE